MDVKLALRHLCNNTATVLFDIIFEIFYRKVGERIEGDVSSDVGEKSHTFHRHRLKGTHLLRTCVSSVDHTRLGSKVVI